MKKTAAICLVLLAALSLGLAGKAAAGCNDLVITSQSPQPDRYNINCKHGKMDNETDDYKFVFANIGLSGPDCTITFRDTGWNGQSLVGTYRFQQNYCSTHSGRITVHLKSGSTLIYTTKEGDWSEQRRGVVVIRGFSAK